MNRARSRKKRSSSRALRPRSTPVRLALIVLATGYVALSLGSGLDRATRDNTDLAPYVPAAFAANAHAMRAALAVQRKDVQTALAESRLAIVSEPLSAGNLAVFGTASATANRPDDADRAFELSGQLSRTDAFAQIYLLNKDMAQGRPDSAVNRLDGLLRSRPALTRAAPLMQLVEGNLATQGPLQRVLATRPPWLAAYTNDVVNLEPELLGLRALMLADLGEKGTKLGCADIDAMAAELARRQQEADGHTLWQIHCSAQPGNLLWDGDLAQLADGANALSDYRWKQMPSGDVNVTFEAGERSRDGRQGRMLGIDNRGDFPTSFLRQLTVLAPGRYTLRWKEQDDAGKPSAAVTPKLSCGTSRAPVAAPGNRREISVSIPAECPAVWIEFQITPQRDTVHFGAISLVESTLARDQPR